MSTENAGSKMQLFMDLTRYHTKHAILMPPQCFTGSIFIALVFLVRDLTECTTDVYPRLSPA